MSYTIINDRTNIRGIFISSIKPTDAHLIKSTVEAFLGRVGWTEIKQRKNKYGTITARVRIDSWIKSDFALTFKTNLLVGIECVLQGRWKIREDRYFKNRRLEDIRIEDEHNNANYDLWEMGECLDQCEKELEHETETILENLYPAPQQDSFQHFIEQSEKEYWGDEYLSNCIETHKSFCYKVNDMRCNVDFTDFTNIIKLREALEQSNTLFTELVGERFRLEHELSLIDTRGEELRHLEYNAGKMKFPSKELLSDSTYASFHNKEVIKMSRAMVAKHATQNNLMWISMYLYDVKTKIQQMATTNHEISTLL